MFLCATNDQRRNACQRNVIIAKLIFDDKIISNVPYSKVNAFSFNFTFRSFAALCACDKFIFVEMSDYSNKA